MLNALQWNLFLTAVLAVVLAAACRAPSLQRRPALRHWLWLLLLVKLVTPPLVELPLLPTAADLASPTIPVVAETNVTTPTAYHETGSVRHIPTNAASENAPAEKSPADVATSTGADSVPAQVPFYESTMNVRLLLVNALLAVSLAGTLTFFTIHGLRIMRLRRWLARAATENRLLTKCCNTVAASLAIRGVVRSCVVETRTSPMLWMWGQPLVVVPRRLLDDLSPQQLRAVVAHELAHFLRRDHWANGFVFFVKGLLWWNPVVWWADRELHAAQELCCDAIAIDCCGADRRGYAVTLLETLEFIQPDSSKPCVLATGMWARGTILRRFEMIAETKLRYRLSRGMLLILLALGLPLVCIPVRGRAQTPPPASAPPAKAEPVDVQPDAAAPQKEAPKSESEQPAKAKITLESLGFTTMRSGPGSDKEDQQQKERNERISQALTAGRFRLLNLEVIQVHICRDVASGTNFKVQRIQRSDQTEIAKPRPDFGPVPPSVKQTSWQEHLQAIREGKRELISLETTNNYTYEMTADDGTKEVFNYGGKEPLDVLVKKHSGPDGANTRTGNTSRHTVTKDSTGTQKETVVGVRPQGNCSISGTVISEATGKPIEHARMYLHYNVTHGSIFVNTASDGTFVFKGIPTGPYSMRSSHTRGYQDAIYNPEGATGEWPDFSLKDGEQRTDVVLRARPSCQISGKVMDEDGKVPDHIDTLTVLAWIKNNDKGYTSQQARVNQADGSYVIDGLSDKPVYLMAINWRAAREGNAYPPIYYPGTFSRNDATLVTFDKSPHAENMDITLRKTGGIIVEGTVHDADGKPVPEAFIVAHRPDMLFDFVTAYTDQQGHYQLQGLGEGKFLIHVDAVHRGWVRTRESVELDKSHERTQKDFTLSRGVLISGKFVDDKGNAWQIGESFGFAHVNVNQPAGNEQGESHSFSLTHFWNKFRPNDVKEGAGGSFILGQGDYPSNEMMFPTQSTFVIQGVMSGRTLLNFLPNKEGQKVIKILRDGQDILTSGIDTQPGEEIKDVTIVVGTP